MIPETGIRAAADRGGGADERIAEVDTLTSRLLDGVTPATQDASQRRVEQLEVERRALRAELESLERLGLSELETEAVAAETAAFLSGLESVLAAGGPGERRAAVRRCAAGVVVDAERGKGRLQVRRLPMADEAAASGGDHGGEITLPK